MDRPTIGFQLHRERMEKLPEDRSNLFIRDRSGLLPTFLRVCVPRMDRWIDSWRTCGPFSLDGDMSRERERDLWPFFAWSSKLKLGGQLSIFFSCLFEIFVLFLLIFSEERMFQPLDQPFRGLGMDIWSRVCRARETRNMGKAKRFKERY